MARRIAEAARRWLLNAVAATSLLLKSAPVPAEALIATSAIQGIAPALAAFAVRNLLNGLVTHDRTVVLTATVVIVVTTLLTSLPTPLVTYLQTEVRRRLELQVTQQLFRALNSIPELDRFEQPAFLDQVRLGQQAGQQAPQRIAEGLVSGIRAGAGLVGFTVALIGADPRIALIALAAVVPATVIDVRLNARRAAAEVALTSGRRRTIFYSIMQTDLRAAKEVRLFGLGDYLCEQMVSVLRSVTTEERRRDRMVLRGQVALQVLGLLCFAAGIALAGTDVWTGRLQIGDVALVLAALAGIQGSIAAINNTLGQLTNALTLFGNYRQIVSGSGRPPTATNQPVPGALRRGISLRDVWFRYDEHAPWVLRGINLTLAAGTATALVGVNGAGKSTLVKLLCGLYTPTRGAIYWDDIPVSTLDPAEYRRRFSAVFQDFMTYDLTARQNIAIGDVHSATDESVVAAARAAGLHETLSDLPAGYDTLLSRIFFGARGARGALLSGGQWQRLAIARALVRAEADVLILDEPSSGLDAEAEHQLLTLLRALRRRQTSLMISHRLNSVTDADTIVVLADGIVAEQGTHAALLGSHGRYAELFRMQAEGYRDPRPTEA